ncbi:diguanylate cyclase, GGDEF domain-containing protein [Phthorimaea operculella]|nr:diguanylate cyclase, GGDEF domain-containing protein [Phthorimaea operculella]
MCGWRPKLAIGKKLDDVARIETNKAVDIKKHDDLEVEPMNFDMMYSKDEENALVLQNEGRSLVIQLMVSPLPLRAGTAGHVFVLLDVTSPRAQVKELSYRAAHDALTGLPNRDSFERYLRNATANDGKHAIVFVDLDGFKKINDSAGHAAGDALLTQVAKLMKSQIRRTDFVARLGGDEFGLILFNCGLQQAEALMSVLVKQINDYQFCWQGEVLHFGASVGITTVGSRKDLGVIIAEADNACLEAKRRGKGQVCVYTGV